MNSPPQPSLEPIFIIGGIFLVIIIIVIIFVAVWTPDSKGSTPGPTAGPTPGPTPGLDGSSILTVAPQQMKTTQSLPTYGNIFASQSSKIAEVKDYKSNMQKVKTVLPSDTKSNVKSNRSLTNSNLQASANLVYQPIYQSILSSMQNLLNQQIVPLLYNGFLSGPIYNESIDVDICSVNISVSNIGQDFKQAGNPNLLYTGKVYYTNITQYDIQNNLFTIFILVGWPKIPISMTYSEGSCPILGLEGPPVPYINNVRAYVKLNCQLATSVSGSNVILTATNWNGNATFLADQSIINVTASPIANINYDLGPKVTGQLNGGSIQSTISNKLASIPSYQIVIPSSNGVSASDILTIIKILLANPYELIVKPMGSSQIYGTDSLPSTVVSNNVNACFGNCNNSIYCMAASTVSSTNTCYTYNMPTPNFMIPQIITFNPDNAVYSKWLYNGVGWFPQSKSSVMVITFKSNTGLSFPVNYDWDLRTLYVASGSLIGYFYVGDDGLIYIDTNLNASSYGWILNSENMLPDILSATNSSSDQQYNVSLTFNNLQLGKSGSMQANGDTLYLEKGDTISTNKCYDPYPARIYIMSD